jgi:hypothetical protein
MKMNKKLSTYESLNNTTGEIQTWKVNFISGERQSAGQTRNKKTGEMQYATETTPLVQFSLLGEDGVFYTTPSYYASTIANGKGGLDLIGYADWAKISATTMDKFRKVIQQELKGI